MDKNSLLGLLLIGLILIGFSYLNRPSQEQLEAQKKYNDSISAVYTQQQLEIQESEKQESRFEKIENAEISNDSVKANKLYNLYGEFSHASEGNEAFVTIENELLEVVLSTKGGRVYSVRLKEYTDKNESMLTLFNADESSFGTTLITANNRIINTKDFYFNPVKDGNKVIMSLNAGESHSMDFIYTLEPNDYMLRFEMKSNGLDGILSPGTYSLDLQWTQKIRQQETGRSFENRYARLNYKFTADDVEELSDSKDDSENITNKLKWIGFKDQYFSSVLIAENSFDQTKLESKVYSKGSTYLKEYNAATTVSFDLNGGEPTLFHYYFGPNDYQLLKKYDKNQFKGQDLELEKLVPLGWSILRYVNKWVIIPLFDFWTNICGNIGLAIFLLTLTIKMGLFPLTYKSFMSSAKMRVMRPQVMEINEKYPGQENAMTRQQKTMELYKQVGVNPMSGCLPMLLQFPFLFALFMFFPTAIELRHESFLWAKDLSTYDAVISWDFNIPIISNILGNHISLFCLLMSLTQVLYTKFNMDQTNTGQEQMPGMKLMMYFMPVVMFFVLNSYPSGLNYYYFISSLITILQTVAFRFFINEDKLLAKLEENKKKPVTKKKSGFMARLEEAQRQQQAIAKQRAQQQKGAKRK